MPGVAASSADRRQLFHLLRLRCFPGIGSLRRRSHCIKTGAAKGFWLATGTRTRPEPRHDHALAVHVWPLDVGN